MKAAVLTFGCKINQRESDSVAYLLQGRGWEVTESEEAADLFLINTCAVTGEAERKCRQAIRRLAGRYPAARILVFGCAAQHDPQSLAALGGVCAVGGTYDKCGLVRDWLDGRYASAQTASKTEYLEYPPGARFRTRDYVKVQDGCDNFCSYCIVPYLRGRSRSRSAARAVAEAEASPAREIVVTGIDLSSYRDGDCDLAGLLARIRHPRIRLGSLEPNAITERLLETMRDDRFCKHFHLSMQSGSDRVLRAMNRRYTAEEYLQKIALIRQYYPEANITTDCIAGFPTETGEEHAQTLATARRAGFGDMHVFPYSERPGTRAAAMRQVPKAERARRAREIAALARQMRETYRRRMIGVETVVLSERSGADGVTGYTPHYLPVRLPGDTPTDRLLRVRLDGIDGEFMTGTIIR